MNGQALSAAFELTVGEGEARFSVSAELELERGVLVLFGPSGAGKTLTLQALGGLLRPTSGTISVRGQTFFDGSSRVFVPPRHRQVGYVPQHHALFPFRSVLGNVVFGLPRARRRRDDPGVAELLDELGIAHLADKFPASLSGGERQRVAVARALAARPQLLLLDEPFASIDLAGRTELRQVLLRTLAQHSIPAVFVTHDPDEARAVGDRVALFESGRTVSGSDGALDMIGRGAIPEDISQVSVEGVCNEEPRDLKRVQGGLPLVEVSVADATVTAPRAWVRRDGDGRIRISRPGRAAHDDTD